MAPAVIALVVAGCSSYHLIDVAGDPVLAPAMMASTSELRLAAESTAAGMRVIAELVMPTTGDAADSGAALPTLTLRTADWEFLSATGVAAEAPICVAPVHVMPPMPEEGQFGRQQGRLRECGQTVRVVRAEFRLAKMPTVGDSVYLRYGARSVAARWVGGVRRSP